MKKYTTYEVCPHCETEVELNAELMVQTCPHCGKRIVACSMCRACEDTEHDYCTHCCLAYQAKVENEDAENDAKFQAQVFGDQPKAEPYGIMDATNGHNADLVDEINEKWDRFKNDFKPILCALYERDAQEIYESEAFSFDEAADVEWVKDYMKNKWEEEAENYLMHIADDQDLELIIKFVRYDVCEGTGRERIFTR